MDSAQNVCGVAQDLIQFYHAWHDIWILKYYFRSEFKCLVMISKAINLEQLNRFLNKRELTLWELHAHVLWYAVALCISLINTNEPLLFDEETLVFDAVVFYHAWKHMKKSKWLDHWAHYVSDVATRVLKAMPKMAEIDVKFRFLSIVFVCAVNVKPVELIWGSIFIYLCSA